MLSGEEKVYAHVGLVIPDSAAEEAGFLKGDVVLAIDDQPVLTWDDVVAGIAKAVKDKPLIFSIERDAQQMILPVYPRIEERPSMAGGTKKKAFVGISADKTQTFIVEHTLASAVMRGADRTWYYISMVWEGIVRLATGKVPTDQIGGPFRIAEVAGDAGSKGAYSLLLVMVIISVNLGILNLLPIPMLDGGHLLFYLIEALRGGRPVSEKMQDVGYKFGFVFVMGLMTFAISNDIRRIAGKFLPSDAEINMQQEEK